MRRWTQTLLLVALTAALGMACQEEEAPARGAEGDVEGDAGDSGAPSPDATTDQGEEEEVADLPEASRTRALEVFARARITSRGGEPNFQAVEAEVDWGQGPFARVVLVVDLDTTCFPFERWQENPPPAGQNFPADCDAFDRNFEFTLDEPRAEGEPPALELVRAITPFGGPMHMEIDVTDIANARPGARRIRSHITTWSDGAGQVSGSDGGWFVSARLEVTEGPSPRPVLGVEALLNHSYGAETALSPIPFVVPEGTARVELLYRTTGHGGAQDDSRACIGPAEEFCRRTHRIILDEEALPAFIPWRGDCEALCTLERFGGDGFEYCRENPTGSIASVRAPRANWCPGSQTPPQVYDLLLAPGAHSFRYEVDGVKPGGSWRTSAAVIYYGAQ
jgi:hypothetical protein